MLEVEKVLIGFQIGIALDDDQEARKSAGEARLGLLEFLKLRRVVQDGLRDLNGACLRPRSGYFLENLALVRRVALHGSHQTRHQVRAPLIHVLNLGPLGIDVLLQSYDVVVDFSNGEPGDHEPNESESQTAKPDLRPSLHAVILRIVCQIGSYKPPSI